MYLIRKEANRTLGQLVREAENWENGNIQPITHYMICCQFSTLKKDLMMMVMIVIKIVISLLFG